MDDAVVMRAIEGWQRESGQRWQQVAQSAWCADALPIIPAIAAFREGSTLAADVAGKAPGTWTPDGWAGMKEWRGRTSNSGECGLWSKWDAGRANIGMQMRRVVGLDLDLADHDDRGLAELVARTVFKCAGATAVRRRTGSFRCLMPYRVAAEDPIIGKQVVEFRTLEDSIRAKLEFLAQGQQGVFFGVHPSGGRYYWEHPPQLDPSGGPQGLPTFGQGDFEALLVQLHAVAEPLGLQIRQSGHNSNPARRQLIGTPDLKADDLDRLAQALACIPNERLSYQEWLQVLIAAKAASGGDDAFFEAHVVPWSQRYGDNTPDVTRQKWDSIDHAGIGAGWLEATARRYGYQGGPLRHDLQAVAGITVEDDPLLDDWLNGSNKDGNIRDAYLSQTFARSPIGQTFLYTDRGQWLRHEAGVWRGYVAVKDVVIGELLEFLHAVNPKLAYAARAVGLERALRKLRLCSDAFDADPWLLNTPNCVVDLRTGTMRPHAAGDRFQRITKALYQPGTTCPHFMARALQWCAGRHDLRQALVETLASTLIGIPQEPWLVVFKGAGRNGKSLCVNTLVDHVLGSYAAVPRAKSFAQSRRSGSEHSGDMKPLIGGRAVFVTESGEVRLDMNLIKAWTAGDRIAWRDVGAAEGEPFRGGRLVLICNAVPELGRIDYAIKRRMLVLPWDETFDEDASLADELAAEAEGILALLVDTVLKTKGRIVPTEDMLVAVRDVLGDADTLWRRCDMIFDVSRDSADMLDANVALTAINNAPDPDDQAAFMPPEPVSLRRLTQTLRTMGATFARNHNNASRSRFGGVRLRSASDWID